MRPIKLHTSCTLVRTSIYFIASNLNDRGLNPLLLIQNQIYLVSVCPINDYSLLTFNLASMSLCKTFYKTFLWSLKSLWFMTSISYIYACTVSNPFNSSDILFGGYWLCYITLLLVLDIITSPKVVLLYRSGFLPMIVLGGL